MNRVGGQAGCASSPIEHCPMMKGLAQEAPQGDQCTRHPENNGEPKQQRPRQP
jgi:hypothetical protein